jgi:hypothetical protein
MDFYHRKSKRRSFIKIEKKKKDLLKRTYAHTPPSEPEE